MRGNQGYACQKTGRFAFLSSTATPARAVQLGAADFLTKPVKRDQLPESVEACLSRNKRRTTPPDYGPTPPV